MTDDEKTGRAYAEGRRSALRYMLGQIIGELRTEFGEDATAERLLAERIDAIAALREVCAKHGDNDWPDDLNLADVIGKHLARHLALLEPDGGCGCGTCEILRRHQRLDPLAAAKDAAVAEGERIEAARASTPSTIRAKGGTYSYAVRPPEAKTPTINAMLVEHFKACRVPKELHRLYWLEETGEPCLFDCPMTGKTPIIMRMTVTGVVDPAT